MWTVVAVFLAVSIGSGVLNTTAIAHSGHRAVVVRVASRQRTLISRYVAEVLIVRSGGVADPAGIGAELQDTTRVLLAGGEAPTTPGDDDSDALPAAQGRLLRTQLAQEALLVQDLRVLGSEVLRPVSSPAVLLGGEQLTTTDPVLRLRQGAALASNVALNVTRTVSNQADSRIRFLTVLSELVSALGLLAALLMAALVVRGVRRQSAHFRSFADAVNDLLMVVDGSGVLTYVSPSVEKLTGRSGDALRGRPLAELVDENDAALLSALLAGTVTSQVLSVSDAGGSSRTLEASISDLRADRHVRGFLLACRDVTDRVQLERELSHQAFHDALTGLANRALFQDRLAQSVAQAARTGSSVGVLLLDLDGFKRVNDSLGHGAGDVILQVVAARMSGIVRPGDTLARLGGDEFAVILANCGEHDAVALAERLVNSVAQPASHAGRLLVVGASVGVAMVDETNRTSAEDVVRRADIAMYAAKDGGRGRVEVYRQNLMASDGSLLGFDQELRSALERDEFVVWYQPQVDLRTGDIVGAEALVRWDSPVRGVVGPVAFIPTAEATSFIVPLGAHVLREACRQAEQWRREGRLSSNFVMWVNLSARQLEAGSVAATVLDALSASGLPASRLGLEITETAIVSESTGGDHPRQELERLVGHGVHVAVDDFGTGFSALVHLRRFPVDVVKIDRTFIAGLDADGKDATIVANVINLAHSLGAVVVAEGVETEGQLARLRTLDCDHGQGYLFARPSPANAAAALLGVVPPQPPSSTGLPAAR
jgi:diguanylate cyclase (GGDEF)-like protein/PAS domain S-box-containing protein